MKVVTWDQSRFDAVLPCYIEEIKGIPREEVPRAAYFVAINAEKNMPRVSIDRMDEELSVLINPVRLKSGKISRNKKRKYEAATFGGMGEKAYKPTLAAIPLAWLIISARANPSSRYNQLTGGAFKLDQHPLKGKKVSEFKTIMEGMARRMLMARHRSKAFFASAWLPAIRAIFPFIPAQFRLAKFDRRGPDGELVYGQEKGGAVIDITGDRCVVTMENAIGVTGPNAEKRNEALWQHGAPALQQGFDQQARYMERKIQWRIEDANRRATVAIA